MEVRSEKGVLGEGAREGAKGVVGEDGLGEGEVRRGEAEGRLHGRCAEGFING